MPEAAVDKWEKGQKGIALVFHLGRSSSYSSKALLLKVDYG